MKLTLDEVFALALTLSHAEQDELIRRLREYMLEQRTAETPLTADEKIRLLESMQTDTALNEQPSIRREDWYGEDGR